MKNKKLFNESVETGAEINVEIKQVLNPEISSLQKAFKAVFGFNGAIAKKYSEYFLASQTADPKIAKVLSAFGELYTINTLNNNYFQIQSYLKEKYNIVISQDELPVFKSKKPAKLNEIWLGAFNQDYKGESKKEALDAILEKMNSLVDSVIKNKQQLSEEIAPEVEEQCEVEKALFNSVVGFKTAEKCGTDPQAKLDTLRSKMDLLEEILNEKDE
jgi:hypothetical protein